MYADSNWYVMITLQYKVCDNYPLQIVNASYGQSNLSLWNIMSVLYEYV